MFAGLHAHAPWKSRQLDWLYSIVFLYQTSNCSWFCNIHSWENIRLLIVQSLVFLKHFGNGWNLILRVISFSSIVLVVKMSSLTRRFCCFNWFSILTKSSCTNRHHLFLFYCPDSENLSSESSLLLLPLVFSFEQIILYQ